MPFIPSRSPIVFISLDVLSLGTGSIAFPVSILLLKHNYFWSHLLRLPYLIRFYQPIFSCMDEISQTVQTRSLREVLSLMEILVPGPDKVDTCWWKHVILKGVIAKKCIVGAQ